MSANLNNVLEYDEIVPREESFEVYGLCDMSSDNSEQEERIYAAAFGAMNSAGLSDVYFNRDDLDEEDLVAAGILVSLRKRVNES